jgi:hypothetical protein
MSGLADSIRTLRTPLIIASTLLGLAVACAVVASRRHDAKLGDRASVELQARAKHAEVAELRRQLDIAKASIGQYQLLRDKGVVGRLDRPDALDKFEATARRFDQQVGAYRLGGQTPVQAVGAAEGVGTLGGHQLYRYEMSVEMKPRHEESFLRMLDQLATAAGPTTLVENCELSRVVRDPTADKVGGDAGLAAADAEPPELLARCVMAWHNFEPIVAEAANIRPAGVEADVRAKR